MATGPVASWCDEPHSAPIEHGEESSVQAVVLRQSGELRIGHRLRHQHERDGNARDCIGAHLLARQRKPSQEREKGLQLLREFDR